MDQIDEAYAEEMSPEESERFWARERNQEPPEPKPSKVDDIWNQ